MEFILNKVSEFGFPFHQIVVKGTFSLPRGTEIPYPGIINGDTQLVAVPNIPSINRSLEQQIFDQEHGFEWRNYALVTDNRLGHVNLNDQLYQWIIYIDDNKVPWHLRFGLSLTNFQTASMWCEVFQPFGRIAKEHPISQLSQLVSQKATVNGAFLHKNRFTLERNSRGSEVLVHLYASASGNPGINNVIDFPKDGQFQSQWGLYEVWKLKISGCGLMTEDMNRLGEGISATLERYLSFDDIQKREVNNIQRQEVPLRVNHVSYDLQQTGDIPISPNCEGRIVDLHENWAHGLTPADTTSQGGYFFNTESVVHKTYDWNGPEVVNTNIVRVLFDKNDDEYRVAVRNTTKSLNKKDVSISGGGGQNVTDVSYQLVGGVCKQQPSPYNRSLNLISTITQQTKIAESTKIFVNDIVVRESHLEEIRSHTETQIRTITESGTHYPSSFIPFQSSTYNDDTESVITSALVITHNGEELRNFTGQPSDIPVSPFSDVLVGDDPNGIYRKLGLGFISNNLMGLVLRAYLNKDEFSQPISTSVQGLSAPNVMSEEIEWRSEQVFGSFEPMKELQSISSSGPIGWV